MRVLSHGSGVPLLLMHGVSLMAAAWAPLFAELQGFRLLALDLPGHGFRIPSATGAVAFANTRTG